MNCRPHMKTLLLLVAVALAALVLVAAAITRPAVTPVAGWTWDDGAAQTSADGWTWDE